MSVRKRSVKKKITRKAASSRKARSMTPKKSSSKGKPGKKVTRTVKKTKTRRKTTTVTKRKLKASTKAYSGWFISLEGGEGTGKSTQIATLAQALTERGLTVVVTREPGGSPKADLIRGLILDDRMIGLHPMAELMLYEASRAQHVAEVIRPALEAGKIVLCDRFADSSVVYQGKARGLDAKLVEEANQIASQGLNPDLTLFFDLDPRIGLGRIGSRGVIDRMERERLEFHTMVHDGYKKLARENRARIKTIDASKTREQIANSVLEIVLKKVEGKR